jgi:PAS domain S-box-containing protein
MIGAANILRTHASGSLVDARTEPPVATVSTTVLPFDAAEPLPALSRVHASGDASVVIVGRTIVFASGSAVEIVGAACAADVVGRDVFDFVAPSSTEAGVARHESAKSGRWPRPELITIKRADGLEKQVEVASTPVLWGAGLAASQLTMWEPPEGAERLRQLATGVRTDVPDAVVILDTDLRIQSLNNAAEELYGWAEAEVLGKPVDEVMPWLSSEAEFQAAQRLLLDEGRWHGHAVQGRRDGTAVHVLASTSLMTDRTGRTTGVISVNRPVSGGSSRPVQPAGTRLHDELDSGLTNDEFVVHYQPIVRLDDGSPIGVEALVRWNHPTRGLLLPAEFIEAAERSGHIGDLGEIVLDKACTQARLWRDAGLNLFLSANVSARQLADRSLPARLADIMARTGTRPNDLWIEITETALVEDLDQARQGLRQIDELGVHLSIDDFGTGWASLTYLREFPVHALKIDRIFVDGLGSRSRDLAIVKSIIGLGRELGLDVVAEGIETLGQRALLYQLGCEKGQGYLFGAPAPADEVFRMPATANSST